MSDPSDDQRDELASAYLDGEATAAERARVEADPELVRRVAQLGVVRAALGAPGPSAGAETRDHAIATALAAASPPAATVTPIERHRSSRRALTILGAAAAAVGVIAAVAVVATRSSNTGTSSSAAVSTTARAAAGSTATFGPQTQSPEAATSPAPTGGVSSTTVAASPAGRDASTAAGGAPALPYLGVADDDSELRALLVATSASAVSAPPAPATPPALAANSCTVPAATLVGTVTWQGTAALVFVANGLATVIQVSDCRPIATVPLT
ncbi:MAG TPA: hypothetical protein VGF22_00045 [Acidimicrobiales bacterium]